MPFWRRKPGLQPYGKKAVQGDSARSTSPAASMPAKVPEPEGVYVPLDPGLISDYMVLNGGVDYIHTTLNILDTQMEMVRNVHPANDAEGEWKRNTISSIERERAYLLRERDDIIRRFVRDNGYPKTELDDPD